MRKARWAAAAAGVVLLVAGCGGEGGSDEGKGKGGATTPGSSSSSAPEAPESEAGESLDAAAVTKEIEDAATAAGFTEEASSDDVSAALKDCMVTWSPDSKKAADAKKSYDDTVANLTKGGWKETQSTDQAGSTNKSLDKGGWTLKATHHGGALTLVMFIAGNNSPECEAAFQEDLEKSKTS
ncbi:hypothetical protein [Streptomyces sp. NPDC000410]|uniref:hypothetical protein n=1 Tax=Streptomyces sp. NPDC000410 TaxID=3154254 RepID=UPI0033181BE2